MARPIKRLYAERNVTEELRRWARSTTIGARDKERANIILLRRGRQNPLQNQARSRRPRQSRGRMNYVMAIESQHTRMSGKIAGRPGKLPVRPAPTTIVNLSLRQKTSRLIGVTRSACELAQQ